MIYETLSIALAIYYAWLMLRYLYYWNRLPEWDIPTGFQPDISVTVIIPARNEAANIVACLESIVAQSYPPELLQILVIDDHSTDATAQLVQDFPCVQVQLITLADFVTDAQAYSFKKKAIETGIAHATGELIVSTDADCIVPPRWLAFFVSYYQQYQAVFMAAPVNFYQEKNALQRFQSLDFVGMMGITGAGIHGQFMRMCNGANLAYPKRVFKAVGGFEGIDHLASGDDMLLLQKIAQQYPDRIAFIKNKAHTVHTTAKATWRGFLNQRIRWASKSNSYTEWWVVLHLALVFLFCSTLLLNAGLALFVEYAGLVFLLTFVIKIGIDYLFLKKMCHFFDRTELLRAFGIASILHPVYIVVVGVLANIRQKYEWKGRRTR